MLTAMVLGTHSLFLAARSWMYLASLARSRCNRLYVLSWRVAWKLAVVPFSVSFFSSRSKLLLWKDRRATHADCRSGDASVAGCDRTARTPAAASLVGAKLCILDKEGQLEKLAQVQARGILLYTVVLVPSEAAGNGEGGLGIG